jgi:hypothetical protein
MSRTSSHGLGCETRFESPPSRTWESAMPPWLDLMMWKCVSVHSDRWLGNLVIMRFSVHLCQRKFLNKHLRHFHHVSHVSLISPLVTKRYAPSFSEKDDFVEALFYQLAVDGVWYDFGRAGGGWWSLNDVMISCWVDDTVDARAGNDIVVNKVFRTIRTYQSQDVGYRRPDSWNFAYRSGVRFERVTFRDRRFRGVPCQHLTDRDRSVTYFCF